MKVILYGAGDNCSSVIMNIEGNKDYEIICVADREPAKWGNMIAEKYKVIAPDHMKDFPFDRIIVTTEGFEEIRNQLASLGLERETIISYQEIYQSMTVHPKNIGTMIADWENGLRCDELYDNLCSHIHEISDLEKEFLVGEHNRSYKWLHYFEIYNRHLSKYYGKDVTIMEVGVNQGGSLQIWKKVFGPNAKIIGIDIMPKCKELEEDQIQIFIGNQEDRGFWKDLKTKIPQVDILIDDGGHEMNQQIVTFEEMFSFVKEDGVYLCEDTGTSYNPQKFHSGYKKAGTWIEFSKDLIDYLHAWFSRDKKLMVNEYTNSIHSVHYYPGVTVVEKAKMYPPFDMEVCNNQKERYAVNHFHSRI